MDSIDPRPRAKMVKEVQHRQAQGMPASGLDIADADVLDQPDLPGAWTFYATPDNENEPWVRELRAGQIVFWSHGSARQKTPANALRLQRGDSVALLVGGNLVGVGVLAAANELRLTDKEGGRRWWPVLCTQIYPEPLSRGAIEEEAGPLVPHQGTAHPLGVRAQEVIDRHASRFGSEPGFPLPREMAARLLAEGEPITAALTRIGYIDADEASLRRLREMEAGEAAERPSADARVRFVGDAPSETEDRLDRGPLALFLARRMHLIWCEMNHCAPASAGVRPSGKSWDRDNFIVHVDAPWGGGKTTFANFVARVLNPGDEPITEGHFLRSSLARAGGSLSPQELAQAFVSDFARNDDPKWERARQPWIIARHNAWRDQSSQPPWWQIFRSVYGAIVQALAGDLRRAIGRFDLGAAAGKLRDLLGVVGLRTVHTFGNSKVKTQIILIALLAILLAAIWNNPIFQTIIARGLDGQPGGGLTLNLFLSILGVGGVSIAALFTALSQSLTPDLDFTAEHKQIGVADPIGRFRKMFDRALRMARRPVLLIVDDIDRCEPQAVVDILRGLQTIVRSPRLFVLVLGDRAWIETAHELSHDKLANLSFGAEAKLGARFVEKVFPLSFRLPAIRPEIRDAYTRATLGGGRPLAQTETAKPEAEALRGFESTLHDILARNLAVGQREELIAAAKRDTTDVDAALLDQIASRKLVAASGSDTGHQEEISNILAQLAESLPNNPRQIKRIMNAFSIYESVGRLYFNYQLTEQSGREGAVRAERWRQLALWVTLSTEWPGTWRAIARRPEILDVAYGDAADLAEREAAFLDSLEPGEEEAVVGALKRMRKSRSLRALLDRAAPAPASASDTPTVADFAATRLDAEAVREFNRIIWELGFDTSAPKAA